MRRHSYAPRRAPNPEAWLRLEEDERLARVLRFHQSSLTRGNAKLHATIHVIVENQLASRDPPETSNTITRLMSEGLSRHDAIHAIGGVLVGFIVRAGNEGAPFDSETYVRELAQLNASVWRAAWNDEQEDSSNG